MAAGVDTVRSFDDPMATSPNNQSNVGVLRSMAIGAAFLVVVTVPGTCIYLYQWIVTGNAAHLGEALALVFVATVMGGSGGAAYRMVIRSRIKSSWKPFLALAAAIEAYLLAFSLPVLAIGLVAPKLNLGLPMDQVRLFLRLHGYGVFLCIVAFGFAYAPRIAQITVGGVGLVLLFLFSVMMIVLRRIGPDDLDLWFAFLKPLSVLLWLLLLAVVVVSIVGWLRRFRRTRHEGHRHSLSDGL